MNIGVGGIVSVGGGSNNGGGSASGITSINSQTGPAILIVGVNGISVLAGGNSIVLDGAGASGTTATKFATSFSSISSGLFTHSLGTSDVIVQIYDNSSPRRAIMPDDIIIENINEVSIIFNTPQSGRIVIV